VCQAGCITSAFAGPGAAKGSAHAGWRLTAKKAFMDATFGYMQTLSCAVRSPPSSPVLATPRGAMKKEPDLAGPAIS
jgi:hypothetical protein